MILFRLLIVICAALTLVGCPSDNPPVPTPEEPVVVEPSPAIPCSQMLCAESKMPACIASAGDKVNAATICDWLLLCERPPEQLTGAGKSTGCTVCIEERNLDYLIWRHQEHVRHGAECCPESCCPE